MARVYSSYEAKTKFGEIIRKVRAGQRVVISYRGEEVAEVRPIEKKPPSLKGWLKDLEEKGILAPHCSPTGPLKPIAKRPGALKRFLESRD